ncbi:MAG: hypothetical protein ACXVQY_13505 [Actinomycetota bacterium]
MFEQTYDHIGELERAAGAGTTADGAESLLNELSGAFDEPVPSEQPVQTPALAEEPHEEVAVQPAVQSPPRLEPPTMIWKPQRRRLRFRR